MYYPEQIIPARAKGGGEHKKVDKNWIAEKKFDGSRYLLHYTPKGTFLTSRRISVKTDKFVEKGKNCPQFGNYYSEIGYCVLDGEIMAKDEKLSSVQSIMGSKSEKAILKQQKSGKLIYNVFDIIYYKGEKVTDLPLYKRKKLLSEIVSLIHNLYIVEVKSRHWKKDRFKKFFDNEVRKGGEGIMLKDLNSIYGEGWFKWKVFRTYDVIITGFTLSNAPKYLENNWIGAIKFGLYKDGILEKVGQTSGMSEEVRAMFSENMEYYLGKVIEVKGQEQNPKTGSIRHPRFIRIREDKNTQDCKI